LKHTRLREADGIVECQTKDLVSYVILRYVNGNSYPCRHRKTHTIFTALALEEVLLEIIAEGEEGAALAETLRVSEG
jgi:hypothetical protein